MECRAHRLRLEPVHRILRRVAVPTSASSLSQDARGKAAASAEISGTSYLPSLHAYARSDQEYGPVAGAPYGGSTRADANVWGVQGYQYVGDTPFLLTISATLDSTFSRPDSDSQGNHSSFMLSIFDTAGYSFGYNRLDATTPELCPIVMSAPHSQFCQGMPTVYARDAHSLRDSGTVTGKVEYLLQPGQDFYVGAVLDASVCCGATVDSSHTLTLAFNDATLLVSRPVAGVVPEPATTWLMLGAAMAGLGVRAARRRPRYGVT